MAGAVLFGFATSASEEHGTGADLSSLICVGGPPTGVPREAGFLHMATRMDQVRTRQRPAAVATAELIAVIVAVTGDAARVLTIADGAALPSGPFEVTHRSLQAGMRSWVEQQTHHPLGYVEQLYTFADRDRTRTGQRLVAISYLGLTREALTSDEPGVSWQSWYRYFPGRTGAPGHRRWSRRS